LSIIETTLIFAGIPAAVILLVAGAVYGSGSRRSKRYRPGRPFEFTPVWFLSAPEQMAEAAADRELTAAQRKELPASAGEWPAEDNVHEQATGGASDRW
jgi:hypothetical protein